MTIDQDNFENAREMTHKTCLFSAAAAAVAALFACDQLFHSRLLIKCVSARDFSVLARGIIFQNWKLS